MVPESMHMALLSQLQPSTTVCSSGLSDSLFTFVKVDDLQWPGDPMCLLFSDRCHDTVELHIIILDNMRNLQSCAIQQSLPVIFAPFHTTV
jgi:hypothetical protein